MSTGLHKTEKHGGKRHMAWMMKKSYVIFSLSSCRITVSCRLYILILFLGITELACGSQAFIATLLFDPSMSALPIIPKQNSVSVGLFTH
jgi:hypothetical protein